MTQSSVIAGSPPSVLPAAPRHRTPTRTGLRASAAAAAAAIVLLGVVLPLGAADRQAALRHAVTRAEPLAVAAEGIYRDLWDADAAAAEVFLSAAQAGTSGQQRYAADVQRVSADLAAVDGDAGGSAQLRQAAGTLLAQLPVFTGLVGTAQADARQNLPVGAAYLRESSALLRDQLLPAAQQVLRVEADRLASDDAGAGAGRIAEFCVLGPAILVLAGVQVFVRRRTRRRFNPGLAGATVAVLVVAAWVVAAGGVERNEVSKARHHWDSANSLIAADLSAVRAHGDELLSLAARGEDLGAYEQDFTATHKTLTAQIAADPGLDDAGRLQKAWLQAHADLLPAEIEPQPDNAANVKALQLATQPAAGSPDAAFSQLDEELLQDARNQETGYLAAARAGHDDLAGLPAGSAGWALVALGAALLGMDRRLKEYR